MVRIGLLCLLLLTAFPIVALAVDAYTPITISEMNNIRNQIRSNWGPPATKKVVVVNIRILLARDGTVTQMQVAKNQEQYASDPDFKMAADAAIKAVKRSSPLKNMPMEKYSQWRDMIMTFDPLTL